MRPVIKRGFIAVLLLSAAATGYFAYEGLIKKRPLPEGLIQANGRIEGDHITAASKVPGRIKKLHVGEADSVAAGQLLVELDMEQAEAKVAQARQAIVILEAELNAAKTSLAVLKREVPISIEADGARVENAKAAMEKALAAEEQASRDAKRFSELAESGAVDRRRNEEAALSLIAAKKDLSFAKGSLVLAETQLSQAKLGWERIKAREEEVASIGAKVGQARAALDEVQSAFDDMKIKAPSKGIIMAKIREEGEVVSPGAPIFDMVDLDRLYLKVYVPEVQIGRLRLGLPARIYTDAFPVEPFEAKVGYISSRAEFTPKEVQTPDERVKLVYAVKLYLLKNPGHRLTPGLPADAVIRWKEDVQWERPRW